MNPAAQIAKIQAIAEGDGRFAWESFAFVSEAIQHTSEWIKNGDLQNLDPGSERGADSEFHVSGRELLLGIRRLASQRWGHLAPCVLRQWGVERTEDFGSIVFLMVHDKSLHWSARSEDRIEDFANGFDFATAFIVWDD